MAGARVPRVLTIAGSDSSGGAGIQADLKAFAACGAHGMCAITAITAQNTVGVSAVEHITPSVIVAQVRAVAEDIGIDVVKIGMLGRAETITAVAEALALLPRGTPVVLDPVMVSESGAVLLEASARAALIGLLPRATVITPNIAEARALAGVDHEAPAEEIEGEAERLARALCELGPEIVIVTGGDRERAVDVFFDGTTVTEIPGPRHPTAAAHGSGCTHSSVLAARLAAGDDPLTAARTAKALASAAVRDGLAGIGAGPGPVDVLAGTRPLAGGEVVAPLVPGSDPLT
jgi:hydroxymethylpyrimidine/phosphomethylpyrimidine kinase